jgi:multidrug resistance efflux pump
MKKRFLAGAAALLAIAGGAFVMVEPGSFQARATPVAVPATPAAARPLLLTGVVDALDSQEVLVPASNSSPVVLRNFVEEGAAVKAGDVVLQIDTPSGPSVEQMRIDADQARARADKQVADLEVKAIEADRALATARAALAKAKVDAALPRGQVSNLDHDRFQGEHERARLDLEVKQQASAAARQAVARRRSDAALEEKRYRLTLEFTLARAEQVRVRARRDGVVVHGYSEWRGERYDEGASAFPGNTVGQVMGSGKMRVRAWAAEADRPFIRDGQPVRLGFDALPGRQVTGTIDAIASAPEPRANWGSARYFRVDVALPEGHGLALVPGMSVLVEPEAAGTRRTAPTAPAPAGQPLEGEIVSRVALPIAPPAIPEVWQYNLTMLAPEGSPVKAGQPVAMFQANDVQTRLAARVSGLRERDSALAKLRLEHAEAGRAGDLAVAEAEANLERARRKSTMPKELIRRVDYDKLVVERALAEELAALAVRQRDAEALARTAEVAALKTEMARHQQAIAQLGDGQKKMTVLAARDGIILYRTQFNGEKIAVGNQVWLGMSVATLADPARLVVQAQVPEAQAAFVRVGQGARVGVPGSNLAFDARVTRLGNTFHGKSSSQPVTVRDVELEFTGGTAGAKPGAAVQVTLLAQEGNSR